MKLFIIYSDLADHPSAWKEVLTYLIDYKHEVCLVTPNIQATKARLLGMGERFSQVSCIEMKENVYDIKQIVKARKSTPVADEDIIIGIPNLEKGLEFQSTMRSTGVILIERNKSHFNKLITFSEKYKRSNSVDFDEINTLLSLKTHELSQSWPIPTTKNIQAQISFFAFVLSYADNYPEKSKAECIVAAKNHFEDKDLLDDVLFTPPNVYGLRWSMFAVKDDRMAQLIEQAEEEVATQKAEKVKAVQPAVNTVHEDVTEDQRLLSSPTRGYGSM